MSAPTADLFEVLEVAADRGSVDRAITRAGKSAVLAAGRRGLITVNGGNYTVDWAVNDADYVRQRDHLYVALTLAGRDYLDAA